MAMIAIQLAGHLLITVTAVVAVAVRIEHRLTIIETDMKWLKQNARCGFIGDSKNEEG